MSKSADLAADWLAGKPVEMPEAPEPRRRFVKGLRCKRGHRQTEATSKLKRDKKGILHRTCRICELERLRQKRREDPEWQRHKNEVNYASFARPRPTLDPDDLRHGTLGGYNYWRCRCQPCKDAIRAAQVRREAEKARLAENEDLARRRAVSARAFSLDEKAERRYGMDRVMTGSTFDDPVFDEVAARV